MPGSGIVLGLSPDVALLRFAGQPVIFNRRDQTISEASDEGHALLELLARNSSVAHLVAQWQATRGDHDADMWDLLGQFSGNGLLRMQASQDSMSFAAQVVVGDTIQAFECGTDQDRRDLVTALALLQLPDQSARADAARASFQIARAGPCWILRTPAGEAVLARPEFLVTTIRNLVLRQVLETRLEPALHCALLQRGERAVLVCGKPGAGKSTFAALATRRGWTCLADDVCLATDDGIEGIGLPLTAKESGWPLLATHGIALDRIPALDRADGAILKYLPSLVRPQGKAVRVTDVILVDRQAGAKAKRVSWPARACLAFLFSEGRFDGIVDERIVRLFMTMVEQARCSILTYPGDTDGVDLLDE